MKASTSLRLRLTAIILGPLMVIALALGFWQVHDARAKAADIFDRSLLTVALAVTSDVARANGNAVSLETRDLLSDTSGGPVFYHVYAPNGYYVTGYATPPVRGTVEPWPDEPYTYYNSTYHGEEVRALRLRQLTTVDGITGMFTVTLWQHTEVRDALMRDLARRALTVIAILIGTVAFVVWFGVRIGLRPLTDLEDAISRRSSDDLSPIRRAVPPEIRGLVLRLNALFGQVQASMARQSEFISNAAHQLRNPIAGVLAMAEAVRSAPTEQAARARADELLASARHARDLANKLLTLERASVVAGHSTHVELGELLEDVTDRFRAPARERGVGLALSLPEEEVAAMADRLMLGEAVSNLVDNALRHGGPGLGRIALTLTADAGMARISIADDGCGVAEGDIATVLSRFGQAGPSEGSGLGLSIAEAVALGHGGSIVLGQSTTGGLEVTLTLPARSDAVPFRQAAE